MHINYVFPECIAYNSGGGPRFKTVVHEADNGDRSAFIPWPIGRHAYNAQSGIKTLSDYESVLHLHHVAQGMAHSFDWKDWADYKSCSIADTPTEVDLPVVSVDGSTTDFTLVKEYTVGITTRTRPIQRPVLGSLLIAVGGTPVVSGWSWVADEFLIRFDSAPGGAVTWGGLFYVPVAFMSNDLEPTFRNKIGAEFVCDYPIVVQEVKLKTTDIV